jgi:dCMP deaminase
MTDKKTQLHWDHYFLGLAEYVSRESKDPSTKAGAVLVRPDNTVASTGWNGFPRSMPDHAHLYADRAEKYPRTVHCEINARDVLSERPTGFTLYTWPFLTCDRCAVQMIQAGIVRVVAPICPPDQEKRWGDTFIRARQYYDECGVTREEIAFDGLMALLTKDLMACLPT